MGAAIVGEKAKINTLVTGSHIGVTLACTMAQVMIIFSKNSIQFVRMYSAFDFFEGVADIFLSVMLWFILDNEE
jgi:hypothetical protein